MYGRPWGFLKLKKIIISIQALRWSYYWASLVSSWTILNHLFPRFHLDQVHQQRTSIGEGEYQYQTNGRIPSLIKSVSHSPPPSLFFPPRRRTLAAPEGHRQQHLGSTAWLSPSLWPCSWMVGTCRSELFFHFFFL